MGRKNLTCNLDGSMLLEDFKKEIDHWYKVLMEEHEEDKDLEIPKITFRLGPIYNPRELEYRDQLIIEFESDWEDDCDGGSKNGLILTLRGKMMENDDEEDYRNILTEPTVCYVTFADFSDPTKSRKFFIDKYGRMIPVENETKEN